jgi:hypothetical protein
MGLEDVTIVIPSSGRSSKQTTLEQLPNELLRVTKLAIPNNETPSYRSWGALAPLWYVPSTVKGISGTRKYLMETCQTRYLAMIDDDMTFAYRPDMASPKLVSLEPQSKMITELFEYWRLLLDKYAHVGLSARQGNNRETEDVAECRRMFNTYMYDLEQVRQAGVEAGRLPVMEDFDLTLQMLRKGLPNAMIYRWCWNQGGSNLPGGCSQYRTTAMQSQAAERLAELHPGFVKVVKKQTKNWQGMEERTDVVVYWSKAYASSQS